MDKPDADGDRESVKTAGEDALAGSAPPEEGWIPIPAPRVMAAKADERVRIWALVLLARQIPHRLEHAGREWMLLVPAAHRKRALTEIRLYEKENRGWPPPPLPAELADNTLVTVSVLLGLAVFHNLTYLELSVFGHRPIDWLRLGSADAGRILAGEWWRALTALTLHADWLHLASNLLIGGIFVVRLCRQLGSGLGWTLLLLTGLLGNLANSLVQGAPHHAIGASTAVFGAIGILAGLGVVRRRFSLAGRWPLPLAAAVALLALLGTGGETTDLGAHLFGFGAGLFLGLLAGRWRRGKLRPGPTINALLAALAFLAPVAAWTAALICSR